MPGSTTYPNRCPFSHFILLESHSLSQQRKYISEMAGPVQWPEDRLGGPGQFLTAGTGPSCSLFRLRKIPYLCFHFGSPHTNIYEPCLFWTYHTPFWG